MYDFVVGSLLGLAIILGIHLIISRFEHVHRRNQEMERVRIAQANAQADAEERRQQWQDILTNPQAYPQRLTKAQDLLRHVVGEKAFSEVQHAGYIDIPSKLFRGFHYRIRRRAGYGVQLWQGTTPRASICIIPYQDLPDDDQFVTLILLARQDEETLKTVGQWSWAVGDPIF